MDTMKAIVNKALKTFLQNRKFRRILYFAVGATFLALVQHSVLVYVCGNDPMLYINAARIILRPGLYGHADLIHALTFVAPGYSLILAAAIGLFGELSPYWVNLAFFIALLPLLGALLIRLMHTERATVFSIAGMLLIVFGSHYIHASWLLYPFREIPRLFFTFSAYLMLLKGTEGKPSPGWLLGASGAFLFACTIREPTLFVLPGMVLATIAMARCWLEVWKALLWLAIPICIAFLLLAAALLYIKIPLTDLSQFNVMRYLLNWGAFRVNSAKMLSWLPDYIGWLGIALVIGGVLRAIRSARVMLALFLLPSILFFIFYSFMQAHIRYFLTSLFFISIFAGYGLDGLVVLAANLFRNKRGRNVFNHTATIVVGFSLAILLFQTALSRQAWGPPVGAREVKQWKRTIENLTKAPNGRINIAVEQRCRYLEDIILSYTDANILDPKKIEEWTDDCYPAHYFRPLNRAALYSELQWLDHQKVYAHRIIADKMNLLPVANAHDRPHKLGGGEFEQYIVKPWQPGHHTQTFFVNTNTDQIVWLDWGSSDAESEKTITIGNAANGKIWLKHRISGNGLCAILLTGKQVDGEKCRLIVDSEKPVPARPVIDVTSASNGKTFDLKSRRILSVSHLFDGVSDTTIERYPFVLSCQETMKLTLPELFHTIPSGWQAEWKAEVNLLQTVQDQLYIKSARQNGKSAIEDLEGKAWFHFGGGGNESVAFSIGSTIWPRLKQKFTMSSIFLQIDILENGNRVSHLNCDEEIGNEIGDTIAGPE
jgi:hypothetical protein